MRSKTFSPSKRCDTSSAVHGTRSGFEVRDRVGGIHLVGSMPTAPMNDAMAPPQPPRYEVFDLTHGVWQAAPGYVTRQLNALPAPKRDAYLQRYWRGLRRVKEPAKVTDKVTGECYQVPTDYDEDLRAKLAKALKHGQITLGGRTYKVLGLSLTGAYVLQSSAGVQRYTPEALLEVLAQGTF